MSSSSYVHPSPPPRLTLNISTPPLRSSSFFDVTSLPDLIPPPPRPSSASSKATTSRNNLFDQDWSPVTPNLRSRSSTTESKFSIESNETPSPASSGRRSWMDMRDDVVIVKGSPTYEKTPIPHRELNWPISPPSPTPFLMSSKQPTPPPPPIPTVTFPPSPTSPSYSTFSPRPPLTPSSSTFCALPPTAGHSENPLLDTRQAPSLRFSPTSNYLLGEGRHASVYLASFSPRSPSPSPTRAPSVPRQLCAAKRLFPDRESQLSGLGEAFILSKLNPSSTRQAAVSSESLVERGGRHVLRLHGVKDERDGLELPLPLLERSESRRSSKRYSGGGGGGSTIAGSPLRSTTGNDSPSSPQSPGSPSFSTNPSRPGVKKRSESTTSTTMTNPSLSPTRSPHLTKKSLLPSLAPPLTSSSAQRYNSQHQPSEKPTLAPSPLPPSTISIPHALTEPRIDLILEFCPFGNALQFARNQPERMNRKRWFQWSRELVAAVALCHERGILHADIKPQNIMIANDLSTRLCDFGMSLFLPPLHSPRASFPTDPHGLGTPTYSPPEFVRPLPSTFSYPSDVFSLGVTLGVLISGREPFEGLRAVERMLLVGNGAWWEWEERKRLKDLEGEQVEVEEGTSNSATASLYNSSFGGDDRLSRQGSLRSLRSEKEGLRRSVTKRSSLRREGSSESISSLASLGQGRDWELIIRSLLVEEGEDPTTSTPLSEFALPPLPTSTSSSPTHSRSTSLDLTESPLSRSYPGTSTPFQFFLDGVSIVPIEVRDLIKRMTSPREEDRPTAKEVLVVLDELAEKYELECL
ncbi:uncharacterized protein JCM6883_000785 [Sporobolomyces salmoneus]|uniref:uncharacterized protein n=1 Tax=Sporobolomyces salmoneus TaxID=183962 RepID=UPI00317C7130